MSYSSLQTHASVLLTMPQRNFYSDAALLRRVVVLFVVLASLWLLPHRRPQKRDGLSKPGGLFSLPTTSAYFLPLAALARTATRLSRPSIRN